MSGGFMVDLTALLEAAEGINAVISDLSQEKVSDILGPEGCYGNTTLGGTCHDFVSRWQIGVQNLVTDSNQVARRLALSAVAYSGAEHKSIGAISGILQRSAGSDPA